MRLTPREIDGLVTHNAGFIAQKRLARGLLLNHTEAVALLACQLLEFIRSGDSVAQIMTKGKSILGTQHVMPGVAALIDEVQVEGTFPDGTKLVTVHQPICQNDVDASLALWGSFLPKPEPSLFSAQLKGDGYAVIVPGEIMPLIDPETGKPGVIKANQDRRTIWLNVTSTCDRPIQVGSHYHFIETNRMLRFDRSKALGMRLNIPSGHSRRFEPGQTYVVPLVEISGRKIIRGGNFLVDGPADSSRLQEILDRVKLFGFENLAESPLNAENNSDPAKQYVCEIPRTLYANTYGPTTGDRVRLADTSLFVRVERDFTVYGDECKFGGGKVLREGMGQMSLPSNARCCVDTVITNALIIDSVVGVIKADVGIKDGFICGIGKAGNPDTMDNVNSKLIVGAGTEAIAGEGLILTAGGIDCHVHFICSQLCDEALASGLTTMIGGGTGPATGTKATTCTPGPTHITNMMNATENVAINFGFTGKGNSSSQVPIPADLEEQVLSGAIGLKLHEDWGSTPAAIDTCLRVAEAHDVQVTIHTDTLNESSTVEHTMAAFKSRTIHAYHCEGAGGGHAPDILRVCGEPHVLPSSTNPTRPYTVNTIDEHVDMLMVCHHLDKNLKEDLAFAESRIRAETIQAEDILHDLGAISIISSDSQAMGRVGEVICRTWQTADKMKKQRGPLTEDVTEGEAADNFRVKRYIAKYTINPAIAHGVSHVVGSVQEGKFADLVLWHPSHFGIKPELIIKGGQISASQMGLANASISTPQPVMMREMFGSNGTCPKSNSMLFVSKAFFDSQQQPGSVSRKGCKRLEAVKGCRALSKRDMWLNDFCPAIHVDPETFIVSIHTKSGSSAKAEWIKLHCEPATELPLAQRYFLF